MQPITDTSYRCLHCHTDSHKSELYSYNNKAHCPFCHSEKLELSASVYSRAYNFTPIDPAKSIYKRTNINS